MRARFTKNKKSVRQWGRKDNRRAPVSKQEKWQPTQRQLAGAIAKEAEYLALLGERMSNFIGNNPYPVPSIYAGLGLALQTIKKATTILDLVLLCQDDKKTKKERQEEEIDAKQDRFREKYDADEENQERQSWEDYWQWIKSFYICEPVWGNPRWLDMVDGLINELPGDVRTEKQEKLERLGEKIAGEWAKDNEVRKINGADLKKWGKKMRRARKEDEGDGAELNKVLDEIEEEVDGKLGGD